MCTILGNEQRLDWRLCNVDSEINVRLLGVGSWELRVSSTGGSRKRLKNNIISTARFGSAIFAGERKQCTGHAATPTNTDADTVCSSNNKHDGLVRFSVESQSVMRSIHNSMPTDLDACSAAIRNPSVAYRSKLCGALRQQCATQTSHAHNRYSALQSRHPHNHFTWDTLKYEMHLFKPPNTKCISILLYSIVLYRHCLFAPDYLYLCYTNTPCKTSTEFQINSKLSNKIPHMLYYDPLNKKISLYYFTT